MDTVKPLELDGVIYNKETIEEIRQKVVVKRNNHLADSLFSDAVLYSHIIALLSHLSKHTEELQ